MRFPLPTGHFFGLNPYDIRVHDGNDNLSDEVNLKFFQRHFALHWSRDWPITGRFDGPTQRACVAVQREHGLPVTGSLDEDTWKAAFTGPKSTESAEHDVPVGTPTPGHEDAPEGVSADSPAGEAEGVSGAPSPAPTLNVNADEASIPDWYTPGKPIGMGSSGPAVRKVRSLLGMQVRDKWSQDVAVRIRGFQKINNLPVTGWIDTQTARLLDAQLSKR